tara:strand:- start:70 stop:594 length:525 start_codon:yes stop_codon:yes gene_type:complete
MKIIRYEDKLPSTEKIEGVYIIHFGSQWVYVGESKNIYTRLNGHRCDFRKGEHKYSNDARIDTIPTDEVYIKLIPSSNRRELEVMIQEEYRSQGRLINKQIGHKMPEESKTKMRLERSRPIIQYDLNMNFIKEWPSGLAATRAGYGAAGNVANFNPRHHTCKGFIWRWKVEVAV